MLIIAEAGSKRVEIQVPEKFLILVSYNSGVLAPMPWWQVTVKDKPVDIEGSELDLFLKDFPEIRGQSKLLEKENIYFPSFCEQPKYTISFEEKSSITQGYHLHLLPQQGLMVYLSQY